MNSSSHPVVVGYDGSPDSDLALAWADETATRTRRPLHVLISEVDLLQVLEATSDQHEAKLTQIENDARHLLAESQAPSVSVVVAGAPPTQALIDASRSASLVVLGARGHGLVSGVVLGSVSQHVSRHADSPVVVVRPAPYAWKRVVVGVDGSPGSSAALEFAAQYASGTGSAALVVIHAWRSLSRGQGAVLGRPFDEHLAEETKTAEQVLAEAVAGLGEKYPDVHGRCRGDRGDTEPLPGRCVGRRLPGGRRLAGRGAFTGMLLGSTSQSVLHHAQCPVAVVR